MRKITPVRCFDSQAEEAVHFYRSACKDSNVPCVARYDQAGARVSGWPQAR